MKIIIFNDLVIGGGTETLLQIFVKDFLKRGNDVTVVASPKDAADFKQSFPSEVHCIRARLPKKSCKNRIYSFGYSLKRKVFRFFSILKVMAVKYDVAISMKEGKVMKDTVSVRALKKLAWIQCDYRTFQHRDWFKSVFPSIDKERRCMQRFDKIVCVSETARIGRIETIGDTGNLCIRYNPIDWEKIRELSKKACGFSKDFTRKLIVAVGRLDPVKNFKCLLEASVLLKNKFDFDLWIVGDGPQKEELAEYIRSNNLTNVKLLGFQANPFPIIKQADLFVSSSISESYGLSVQEALILGVPVVAVKCSGIVESLDPEFGVLVDNSSEELSKAISKLLGNLDELDTYRKSINDNYSLDSLYDSRMEAIYHLIEA